MGVMGGPRTLPHAKDGVYSARPRAPQAPQRYSLLRRGTWVGSSFAAASSCLRPKPSGTVSEEGIGPALAAEGAGGAEVRS